MNPPKQRDELAEQWAFDHTEGYGIPVQYRTGDKVHLEVAKRRIAFKAGYDAATAQHAGEIARLRGLLQQTLPGLRESGRDVSLVRDIETALKGEK